MKTSIDRFEGSFAVCENADGTSMNIERSRLPKGAKPGDVLSIVGDTIGIDAEETEARKKKIAALVNDLFD